MLRFLTQRILLSAVVILGAVVVIFALSTVIPADPARAALGEEATQDQVDQYRRELGLDRPLPVQFVRHLGRLLRGDLGRSILTKNSVAEDLRRTIPASIELFAPSLVLSLMCGVVAGVVSAVRHGRAADQVSRIGSVLGMSLPVFWFGLVLQVIFYSKMSWLPAGGRLPLIDTPPPAVTGLYTVDALLSRDLGAFAQAWRHLVLPVVTLSLVNMAAIARITRASLLEVVAQDYVRTARAKGLPERIVIYRHALRNALVPVITVFGMRIGHMFGGSVLTETVFAWPGVGRYAVFALQKVDLPVVVAFTIYVTVAYALLNALVDVSYSLLDPRIRFE